MKKLEKLSMKNLLKTEQCIDADEKKSIKGGYPNDCFWRCVSYMEGQGGTEASAEAYANSYFGLGYISPGCDASVNLYDIPNYYAGLGNSYNPNFSDGRYIAVFNTNDNVGNYANTGGWHAIVITGSTTSGGSTYYDPQSGNSGILTSSDVQKLTYGGY